MNWKNYVWLCWSARAEQEALRHKTNQLIQDVVDKIDLVDQVATNAAAISEEQAASSDEIHATSETTLTQAKHISNHSKNVATEAHKLADSSQQLANQVKRFKV